MSEKVATNTDDDRFISVNQDRTIRCTDLFHCSVMIFRKIQGQYPNSIPNFNSDRIAYCGESLGPEEPVNYPAPYSLDEKYPVVDIESKTKRIEYVQLRENS